MFIGFLIGAILYGAFTLVVLIISSAELLESCTSTPSRLVRVFLMSVFWPITLVVLALGFVVMRLGNHTFRANQPQRFGLSHRPY